MENKSKKLKAKDFITIGIFTAILFAVEFALGMLGYIHPFIVASYVIILPLASGIPMMLFYTKVEKFGMITIVSVLRSAQTISRSLLQRKATVRILSTAVFLLNMQIISLRRSM